jgi:hypothetical protein
VSRRENRRLAVTRDVDFDDAFAFDDERVGEDARFAEMALEHIAATENAAEMDSFFDTAHDEAEWDARFGGGARQSGFAGVAGDDLAMDFLGASSARRGGRATTRDDLNLPDQAMEDLLGRVAGDRLPENGGLDPFDARDSQALPEEAPDERGLPPLPLDESDEDEDAPYRPDDTDAEAGTGTGTGTGNASGALNVTHSSVAPSPAMLELEAAARARAGKAVRPRRAGKPRPGTARHRMQTVDAETHLGGGAYRMWLKDASDTRVRGGRPCFGTAPVSKPTSIGGRPGEDAARGDFFETLFMGGPRGGVLFRAAARDGEACAGLRAHFHALFEARRQPWPTCARGARAREPNAEGDGARHPEEALALEAEALALEAEREVALERDRERRGKLKHLKRSEALGEVSSDDEGGYKPGPIAMAHGDDDDDVLPPPPMYESDDDDDALPPRDAFRASGSGLGARRRRGLSLADLLEGCFVDERDARSFSVSGAAKNAWAAATGSLRFGSDAGNAPSSIRAASSGDTRSTYGVSQYRLRESEPSQSAMSLAARGASAGSVGGSLAPAAYNLMQFLSRGVFTGATRVASLRALCADNGLRRGSAARCFYQTLVLAGGGYLDAAQDLSEPYGEILIRPGARWMAEGEKSAEEGGGRKRGADDDDDDDDDGDDDGDGSEPEPSEAPSESEPEPEPEPEPVPARRSKRARRG